MADEYDVAQATEQIANLDLGSAERGEAPQDCLIGDNGSPIDYKTISVHAPQSKGNTRFTQFYVYPITSIPINGEGISRRYSEFEWLYTTLVAAYPGVFVPPIPGKKMWGSNSDNFLEGQRRPNLERFLCRVAQIPILAESAPFQAFMSRTHSFDVAQREITKKASLRTNEQLLQTFEYYFARSLEQELPVSIEGDFTLLNDFCKEKENSLTDLTTTVDELQAAVAKQIKLLGKLTTTMASSEQHEQSFEFMPPQATKFSATDNFVQWLDQLKVLEPHYNSDLFLQHVTELEDIKAFTALLAARKALVGKSERAHSKAVKWDLPNTKCQTDKERAQRELDFQNDETLAKLVEYVNKIMWFEQFQDMWKNTVEEYNSNLSAFAVAQSSFAQFMYHNFESFHNENSLPEEATPQE